MALDCEGRRKNRNSRRLNPIAAIFVDCHIPLASLGTRGEPLHLVQFIGAVPILCLGCLGSPPVKGSGPKLEDGFEAASFYGCCCTLDFCAGFLSAGVCSIFMSVVLRRRLRPGWHRMRFASSRLPRDPSALHPAIIRSAGQGLLRFICLP